jgi:lipid biosynthesis B12-binding/radical SAM protein
VFRGHKNKSEQENLTVNFAGKIADSSAKEDEAFMKVLLISANVATSPYPIYPIGMSMVAAALKKQGHEVELFDFLQNNCSIDAVRHEISACAPALIGISIRNVDNVNAAHEQRYIDSVRSIIKGIREETDSPVMLGGSGFSVMPDEVMTAVGADYGIVGEGEELLCSFVRDLENGILPDEKILYAPMKLERDTIPSAHYEPEMLKYYLGTSRVISIQTKRGCDKHCVYCSYPALEGRNLRMRNEHEVVDDIERLVEQGADYIFFVDSVFNDSKGHYRKLIDEMLRRNIRLPWTAFFTPGGELDDEIVAQMKATGLHAAEMGADASTDTTLRGLGKDFCWQDVIECNELFHRHDVTTAHYYMFGGPGETRETVLEGIENIRNLPNTANFMFMGIRILPDTALLKIAEREGLIPDGHNIIEPIYYFSNDIDRDWLEKTMTEGFADRINCVFPPDALDEKLILLHKMGCSGSGYDMLVQQSESPRRRAMKAGNEPEKKGGEKHE